jgi:ribosomal protein S18 acetylase RimI-like enzyme
MNIPIQTEEVRIRHARSHDFSAIFALLEQLWPNRALNRERLFGIFQKGLDSPRIVYLCLQVHDRVLGFCSLQYAENFWLEDCFVHIDEIIVDKDFRGRGYGTILINHVLKICKEQGCVSILLDSDFLRLNAHKFYEKLGFKKTGYIIQKDLS